MKQTIFDRLTQQIIEAIEAGAGEFVMPWHRTGKALDCPANAITGRAYRGLNVLTLWIEGESAGYTTGKWATYRQWSEQGAQVRKGERGTSVFFWQKRDSPSTEPESGDDKRRLGFVARAFTVFNADQVDGAAPNPIVSLSEEERSKQAEAFIRQVGATIQLGGDQAYYSPGSDRVQMPEYGQFRSAAAYYSTMIHELVHWSGAKHRLDRNLSNRFGSADYAMEELVAELGAAFACAHLGIQTEPRRDHAPYLASWLKALRSDSRAIFTAASQAQAAVDYLLSISLMQSIAKSQEIA